MLRKQRQTQWIGIWQAKCGCGPQDGRKGSFFPEGLEEPEPPGPGGKQEEAKAWSARQLRREHPCHLK